MRLTEYVQNLHQLWLDHNHLVLLLHRDTLLFLVNLRKNIGEELWVACIDNIEEKLAVNELVRVRVVIRQVLSRKRANLANFVIDLAHTQLTVPRNANTLDFVVKIILLLSCEQLLEKYQLARSHIWQIDLACSKIKLRSHDRTTLTLDFECI